jgi:enamine deaminase RidA (YjgF/YER057c/UK114 family)
MTNQSVLDTLSQLSDNIKITFQLIGRLSKLSFQPGSTPLQGDGDVRIELAHDIRDALKQHDDTLDTLRQEIEDVVEFGTYSQRRRDSLKDRERARIAAQLARLDEDLKQYVHLWTPSSIDSVLINCLALEASSVPPSCRQNVPQKLLSRRNARSSSLLYNNLLSPTQPRPLLILSLLAALNPSNSPRTSYSSTLRPT